PEPTVGSAGGRLVPRDEPSPEPTGSRGEGELVRARRAYRVLGHGPRQGFPFRPQIQLIVVVGVEGVPRVAGQMDPGGGVPVVHVHDHPHGRDRGDVVPLRGLPPGRVDDARTARTLHRATVEQPFHRADPRGAERLVGGGEGVQVAPAPVGGCVTEQFGEFLGGLVHGGGEDLVASTDLLTFPPWRIGVLQQLGDQVHAAGTAVHGDLPQLVEEQRQQVSPGRVVKGRARGIGFVEVVPVGQFALGLGGGSVDVHVQQVGGDVDGGAVLGVHQDAFHVLHGDRSLGDGLGQQVVDPLTSVAVVPVGGEEVFV